MLFMIHTGYNESDHCRKKMYNLLKLIIYFFLQCRHFHISREPPKTFYFSNEISVIHCFISFDSVIYTQ